MKSRLLLSVTLTCEINTNKPSRILIKYPTSILIRNKKNTLLLLKQNVIHTSDYNNTALFNRLMSHYSIRYSCNIESQSFLRTGEIVLRRISVKRETRHCQRFLWKQGSWKILDPMEKRRWGVISATRSNEMYPGDDNQLTNARPRQLYTFVVFSPPVPRMISDFYKLFDKRSTSWGNDRRGTIFSLHPSRDI